MPLYQDKGCSGTQLPPIWIDLFYDEVGALAGAGPMIAEMMSNIARKALRSKFADNADLSKIVVINADFESATDLAKSTLAALLNQ